MRIYASAGVFAMFAVGAGAVYAAGLTSSSDSQALRTTSTTSGALSLSDSRGEGAIFSLSNFAPGASAHGEVTIGNSGSVPGTLTLSSFDRSDSPGMYGGILSGQLDLLLSDMTDAAPQTIYDGELTAMPDLELGTLAPETSRTYRFTVSMRDGGAPATPYVGDNVYQRATASLSYQWVLTETETAPPDETPETPPPPPTEPAIVEPPPGASSPQDGPTRLVGTRGRDRLVGTSGADVIRGLRARDVIFGGQGDDRLFGGAGPDRITGGPGRDRLFGGSGSDVLLARDGERDLLDCGSGIDRAYVDARDKTRHCERIFPRGHVR